MKILILQSKSALGFNSGELRVAKNELNLLRSYGHNVELIEYGPGKLNNIFSKIFFMINSIWSFWSYYDIKKIVKRKNPDIIHFHGLFPFLTISSLIAAKNSNSKVVLTLHNVSLICIEGAFYRNGNFCNKCLNKSQLNGVIHGCYKNSLASLFKYFSNKISFKFKIYERYVDRIISVSDFIKEMHVENISSKVITKYNLITPKSLFKKIKSNNQSVTFVGRLTKSKGTETLKYLLNNLDHISINIVGDGPEFTPIKKIINTNPSNEVKMYRKLSNTEVQQLISISNCIIIPSLCAESFSLVAAESMINKTPIICYNVGGLSEIVKKSKGGIAIDINNKNLFKESIIYILNNNLEAEKLGQNGYSFAKKYFNKKINYNNLSKIYKIKN